MYICYMIYVYEAMACIPCLALVRSATKSLPVLG